MHFCFFDEQYTGTPATNVGGRGPFLGDHRSTCESQIPAVGPGKVGGRQERVLGDGGGGRGTPLQQSMGRTPAHGEEAGWVVAALRGLQKAERSHGTGQLPDTEHDGLICLIILTL